MEPREVSILMKNQSQLYELTTCNVLFLAKLQERDILNKEDVSFLEAKYHSEGRIKQAREFYKIVVTRTDGFGALMEALQDTEQSGALQILKVAKSQMEEDGVYKQFKMMTCFLSIGQLVALYFLGPHFLSVAAIFLLCRYPEIVVFVPTVLTAFLPFGMVINCCIPGFLAYIFQLVGLSYKAAWSLFHQIRNGMLDLVIENREDNPEVGHNVIWKRWMKLLNCFLRTAVAFVICLAIHCYVGTRVIVYKIKK